MGADKGNDSWETALLLSFCCGHFGTSPAIRLRVFYAGGRETEKGLRKIKVIGKKYKADEIS